MEFDKTVIYPLNIDDLLIFKASPKIFYKIYEINNIDPFVENEIQYQISKLNLESSMQKNSDCFFNTIWLIIDKTKRAIICGLYLKNLDKKYEEIEIGFASSPNFNDMESIILGIEKIIIWIRKKGIIRIIVSYLDEVDYVSSLILKKCYFLDMGINYNKQTWKYLITTKDLK